MHTYAFTNQLKSFQDFRSSYISFCVLLHRNGANQNITCTEIFECICKNLLALLIDSKKERARNFQKRKEIMQECICLLFCFQLVSPSITNSKIEKIIVININQSKEQSASGIELIPSSNLIKSSSKSLLLC
jgi:hypothetical protein